MEESVLNQEMLLRLHNKVCQGRTMAAAEMGTRVTITLTLDIEMDPTRGRLSETYKLKSSDGDTVARETGLPGQLEFADFALAGLSAQTD